MSLRRRDTSGQSEGRGRVRRARGPCSGWEVLEARRLLASPGITPAPFDPAQPSGADPVAAQVAPDDDNTPAYDATAGGVHIPGPGGMPYLVVPESPLRHTTLRTAQPLPDVPFFGVSGVLQPGDPVDLYRVALDPALPALHVTVRVQPPSGVPGGSIVLLDSSGRILAFQALDARGQATDQTVSMTLPDPGGVVFIGVGRSGPGGPSVLTYQVWVERQAAPPGANAVAAAPAGPEVVFRGAAGPVPVSPVVVESPPGPSPEAAHAAPNGEGAAAPGVAPGPRLVASGALPTRSAAALGGVLRAGDPTPPVLPPGLPADGAEPLDPAAQSPVTEPAAGATPAGEGRGAEGSALVTLRGPGGFPLEGTALTGLWPSHVPAGASAPLLWLAAGAAAWPVPPAREEGEPDRRPALQRLSAPVLGALSLGLLYSRRDLVRRLAGALRRLAAAPGSRRHRVGLRSLPVLR